MRNLIDIFSIINKKRLVLFLVILLSPALLIASGGKIPTIGPVRIEFIIFAFILVGIALLNKQTFKIAIIGVSILILFKLIFDHQFNMFEHFFGTNSFSTQILNKNIRQGEWGIILNLMGLLLGFAILARLFEESGIPDILPDYLPDDWKGPFVLLVFVFVISSILDNIAAALIGGAIAAYRFIQRRS